MYNTSHIINTNFLYTDMEKLNLIILVILFYINLHTHIDKLYTYRFGLSIQK
jgi:hypothetical protein